MCGLKNEKKNRMRLNEFAEDVHQVAVDPGFWIIADMRELILKNI